MPLHFPYILSKRRSEEGKRIRRQYKNDKGVPYQACKAYQLDQSGTCGTITTFTTDNNIIELTNKHTAMKYHEHPTKKDLLEYFGQRIRIRKMTPTEAFRLMDVDDSDIKKIQAAGISKTSQYKLAGNSIVVAVLYHIFRKMFIDTSNESSQPTLFDF